MKSIIVDNAKVMSKGQITLPKEVRLQLGVDTGDKVIFIAEGDRVIMMNAAVYAMKILIDTNILISTILSPTGVANKAFIKAVSYPNKVFLEAKLLYPVAFSPMNS